MLLDSLDRMEYDKNIPKGDIFLEKKYES